ncbi:uncharacterized protein MONOS_5682 [Monocercomonoides exilis]|uniref:uncharacterized protein n=1 Tax=Monocercomonoides exilis TaxID=2049356 RepID=UPI00355A22D9|nr:hypothetical protein MONOS_5682 [Monocercomonoides exilis]|eukprot:MONOS_5682.1-p1 / transcript=MONOS_5682.1 / gene=MONOS_5682 / organism=Monocercomonoides_exilis_PA203 / gene_product=unspecified product / transcript_product=unspecified product / location=Mono_scaffold00168:65717-69637(-) / protein_length=1307 / sequence_SO=supercontig / SO=protein_coding / is_pseudo=false
MSEDDRHPSVKVENMDSSFNCKQSSIDSSNDFVESSSVHHDLNLNHTCTNAASMQYKSINDEDSPLKTQETKNSSITEAGKTQKISSTKKLTDNSLQMDASIPSLPEDELLQKHLSEQVSQSSDKDFDSPLFRKQKEGNTTPKRIFSQNSIEMDKSHEQSKQIKASQIHSELLSSKIIPQNFDNEHQSLSLSSAHAEVCEKGKRSDISTEEISMPKQNTRTNNKAERKKKKNTEDDKDSVSSFSSLFSETSSTVENLSFRLDELINDFLNDESEKKKQRRKKGVGKSGSKNASAVTKQNAETDDEKEKLVDLIFLLLKEREIMREKMEKYKQKKEQKKKTIDELADDLKLDEELLTEKKKKKKKKKKQTETHEAEDIKKNEQPEQTEELSKLPDIKNEKSDNTSNNNPKQKENSAIEKDDNALKVDLKKDENKTETELVEKEEKEKLDQIEPPSPKLVSNTEAPDSPLPSLPPPPDDDTIAEFKDFHLPSAVLNEVTSVTPSGQFSSTSEKSDSPEKFAVNIETNHLTGAAYQNNINEWNEKLTQRMKSFRFSAFPQTSHDPLHKTQPAQNSVSLFSRTQQYNQAQGYESGSYVLPVQKSVSYPFASASSSDEQRMNSGSFKTTAPFNNAEQPQGSSNYSFQFAGKRWGSHRSYTKNPGNPYSFLQREKNNTRQTESNRINPFDSKVPTLSLQEPSTNPLEKRPQSTANNSLSMPFGTKGEKIEEDDKSRMEQGDTQSKAELSPFAKFKQIFEREMMAQIANFKENIKTRKERQDNAGGEAYCSPLKSQQQQQTNDEAYQTLPFKQARMNKRNSSMNYRSPEHGTNFNVSQGSIDYMKRQDEEFHQFASDNLPFSKESFSFNSPPLTSLPDNASNHSSATINSSVAFSETSTNANTSTSKPNQNSSSKTLKLPSSSPLAELTSKLSFKPVEFVPRSKKKNANKTENTDNSSSNLPPSLSSSLKAASEGESTDINNTPAASQEIHSNSSIQSPLSAFSQAIANLSPESTQSLPSESTKLWSVAEDTSQRNTSPLISIVKMEEQSNCHPSHSDDLKGTWSSIFAPLSMPDFSSPPSPPSAVAPTTLPASSSPYLFSSSSSFEWPTDPISSFTGSPFFDMSAEPPLNAFSPLAALPSDASKAAKTTSPLLKPQAQNGNELTSDSTKNEMDIQRYLSPLPLLSSDKDVRELFESGNVSFAFPYSPISSFLFSSPSLGALDAPKDDAISPQQEELGNLPSAEQLQTQKAEQKAEQFFSLVDAGDGACDAAEDSLSSCVKEADDEVLLSSAHSKDSAKHSKRDRCLSEVSWS